MVKGLREITQVQLQHFRKEVHNIFYRSFTIVKKTDGIQCVTQFHDISNGSRTLQPGNNSSEGSSDSYRFSTFTGRIQHRIYIFYQQLIRHQLRQLSIETGGENSIKVIGLRTNFPVILSPYKI